MADIGKPDETRRIEPLEEPKPYEIPVEPTPEPTPVPEPVEPEKVPA